MWDEKKIIHLYQKFLAPTAVTACLKYSVKNLTFVLAKYSRKFPDNFMLTITNARFESRCR